MSKQTTEQKAIGMAKVPKTEDHNTVGEHETNRVRRAQRDLVKEQVGDLCQRITDDPVRSLRARLLKIGDLSPNQRKAVMQRIADACRDAIKELEVEPAEKAVSDRVADLDL